MTEIVVDWKARALAAEVALCAIADEAERPNGSWVHLRRVIGLKARGASRGEVPFMPTAEMTDDMLIDTGTETITWGELRTRGNFTPTSEADVERLREALEIAETAMAEMFRYYDGGETRGSYDGKPERARLRKAWDHVRAARSLSHTLTPAQSPLTQLEQAA